MLSPSLGSIHLQEWLTDLGEMFYLLAHWFITQEQPARMDAQDKVWHRGEELRCCL